jgi:hypothetical protein
MSGDFDPRLLRALRVARRFGVLAGAGISAESGIPTSRDVRPARRGRHDPAGAARRSIEPVTLAFARVKC